MRARGFALRDKFADALRGIITREEAEDYPIKIVETPQPSQPIQLAEVSFDFSRINYVETMDELKLIYLELKEKVKDNPDLLKNLNQLTSERKKEIEIEQFKQEMKEDDEPISITNELSNSLT
jgi:hypothetical protein